MSQRPTKLMITAQAKDCVQADKHCSCITAMPSCTIWHDGAWLAVKHVSICIWQNLSVVFWPQIHCCCTFIALLPSVWTDIYHFIVADICHSIEAVFQPCLLLALKGASDTLVCVWFQQQPYSPEPSDIRLHECISSISTSEHATAFLRTWLIYSLFTHLWSQWHLA